ncbi:hypothetical protein M9979_06420 [Sphingomonas sp. RP10(2022)]|uniref:Uncharacterized protein n=1 Tax=Sphingomonas liriopis TaxID=2949094 RepID=A0A9X2HVX2_9SPHN|nr:hypothetical protein [Sphingomonas liriopis]MCP3734509.1 hypothetical protein [Sphingomonas liriopis]
MDYELLIQNAEGERRVHSRRRGDMPSKGDLVEVNVNGAALEMKVMAVKDVYRETGSVWRVTLDETTAEAAPR